MYFQTTPVTKNPATFAKWLFVGGIIIAVMAYGIIKSGAFSATPSKIQNPVPVMKTARQERADEITAKQVNSEPKQESVEFGKLDEKMSRLVEQKRAEEAKERAMDEEQRRIEMEKDRLRREEQKRSNEAEIIATSRRETGREEAQTNPIAGQQETPTSSMTAEEHYKLAEASYKNGDYAAAVKDCQKAIEFAPANEQYRATLKKMEELAYKCTACDGGKRVPCKMCDRKGTIQTEDTCRGCNGTGKIRGVGGWTNHLACKGTGKTQALVKCPTCNGVKTTPCDACNGTGKKP